MFPIEIPIGCLTQPRRDNSLGKNLIVVVQLSLLFVFVVNWLLYIQ